MSRRLSRLASMPIVAALVASCQPVEPVAPVVGQSVQCIALDRVGGRRVVEGGILFEMTGPVDYRNALAGACPGLARLGTSGSVSIVSAQGSQLCRGDRIRIADPVETAATGLRGYPTCVLGDFVPVGRGSLR